MSKKKLVLLMQELLYPSPVSQEEKNGDKPPTDMVLSGGDRYTLDLARLVRDLGYEPTIFQRAVNGKFFDTKWEGFRVLGLPSKNAEMLNLDVAQNSQEYHGTIAFHMRLAYPRAHRRTISISHGIWFDHPKMPAASEDRWDVWRQHLEGCIAGVDRVVSVDTNTINFFGALFAGRFHHKFSHIPNSADTDRYKPVDRKGRKTVRVLYPRRAEILRGYTEMQRLTEELAPKYKDAEFHFCGRGHTPEDEAAAQLFASNGPRRAWYWKPFDEMPQVYQDADIAVIPTIGCEGTSYSALESLASGLPVVSTYVGGLSELIIDGYNGLKVAPRYDEIRDAVDYLLRKPDERVRMGENARRTAEQFSHAKWRRQWGAVLHDVMR